MRQEGSLMNQIPTVSNDKSKNLNPIKLLEYLAGSRAVGCLQVTSSSVDWLIYFNQGKITYATHSLEPFERLERHLRRFSHEIATLTSAVRTQVRLNFEIESNNDSNPHSDYQGICWLVEQQYLTSTEAAKIVTSLIKEVFETYLLLEKGTYKFIPKSDNLPIFCSLNWQILVEECQKNLQLWQNLGPKIWSAHQRPYFFSQAQAKSKISSELQQKLGKILRGFSFRQLAALLNQDEVKLAQNLYSLIESGVILLRNPQSPFDQLPKIPAESTNLASSTSTVKQEQLPPPQPEINGDISSIQNAPIKQQKYKVACIDDSPTILEEINRFLEDQDVTVFAISDPVRALRDIIRIKPDLILLDVGMPTIDGYKLCRLIRNHSLFKTKPIVMVTGNTGIIDRAKARLVGATDYMTKPFTQSQLIKMVYRYLT
jgi:two-component system, chemotaxis family, response regulator PixG